MGPIGPRTVEVQVRTVSGVATGVEVRAIMHAPVARLSHTSSHAKPHSIPSAVCISVGLTSPITAKGPPASPSGIIVLSNAGHDFQPQWKSFCDAATFPAFPGTQSTFIIDLSLFSRSGIIYLSGREMLLRLITSKLTVQVFQDETVQQIERFPSSRPGKFRSRIGCTAFLPQLSFALPRVHVIYSCSVINIISS